MTPKVALSSDFLTAYSRLPRDKQKKVRAFIEKFKADPTQSSINYESLAGMGDPKVRTVRIDKAYRAVVIHPPQGDVYLCVWVDHHDEAMDWAKRKRFEVHPSTGSFQVWEPRSGEEDAEMEAPRVEALRSEPVPEERLFGGRTDADLMLLGVPAPLLPAVRALRVEEDLDGLAGYLPQEAGDALYMLACGYSLDDTLEELSAPKAEEEVDTGDFDRALARPGSQRQFKVITDDRELAAMLDAPLAQWRVLLHPSQRTLVTMSSKGSARVLGGAGTGKTVVAMHRARHLARLPGFLGEGQKILFTTFTRNLAADIKQNLDTLCGAERERIEVKHLHGWASRYLKARGVQWHPLDGPRRETLWNDVVEVNDTQGLAVAFYRDEWEKVVQAQDVRDEQTYLRARRTGRGTPLRRAQRKAVWKVLSAYRDALDAGGYMEAADLIREARLHLERNPGTLPYRAVVADEVQDFRQADLRLLRAIVPAAGNDIFVVGDAHQRIYGHKASLGKADINIRGRRSRKLRINYRTTQEIRGWAAAVLEGMEVDDLDEGLDEQRGYRSLRFGEHPVVKHFPNAEQESAYIVETLKAWLDEEGGPKAEEICVVARSNELVEERYRARLVDAGIETLVVKRDENASRKPGVRLATMHRTKGLEFARVAIAGMNAATMPQRRRAEDFADSAARQAHEDDERRVLYVAATRARDALVITGYGDRSPIVR